MGMKEDIEKQKEDNEANERRLRRQEDGRATRPPSIEGWKVDPVTGERHLAYHFDDLISEETETEKEEENGLHTDE